MCDPRVGHNTTHLPSSVFPLCPSCFPKNGSSTSLRYYQGLFIDRVFVGSLYHAKSNSVSDFWVLHKFFLHLPILDLKFLTDLHTHTCIHVHTCTHRQTHTYHTLRKSHLYQSMNPNDPCDRDWPMLDRIHLLSYYLVYSICFILNFRDKKFISRG